MAVLVCVLAGACDSGHPDTGAGANRPVPATETCTDICGRLAECVVTLCNEDTSSSRYSPISGSLQASCTASCNQSQLMSMITPDMWSCIFTQSCRAVFEHDVCHGMSHYNCN